MLLNDAGSKQPLDIGLRITQLAQYLARVLAQFWSGRGALLWTTLDLNRAADGRDRSEPRVRERHDNLVRIHLRIARYFRIRRHHGKRDIVLGERSLPVLSIVLQECRVDH